VKYERSLMTIPILLGIVLFPWLCACDSPDFYIGGTAVYYDCDQSPDILQLAADWQSTQQCLTANGTRLADLTVIVQDDISSECWEEDEPLSGCYRAGERLAYIKCGEEAAIPHEAYHCRLEEICGRWYHCYDYAHEDPNWICMPK